MSKRARRAAVVNEFLDIQSRLNLFLLNRRNACISELDEPSIRPSSRAAPYTYTSLDEREYWYETSAWKYINTIGVRDHDSPEGKKFRRRFAVPFCMFEDIAADMATWQEPDGKHFYPRGRPQRDRPPIRHKLAAYLNILARAATFDDIDFHWRISESSANRGFHAWTKEFVARNWSKWCSPPSASEIAEIEKIYSRLGFPGCIGSMDGVHVGWACCPAQLLLEHKGKEGFPSLVYNVIVDHLRRIYSVTRGNPGTISDKTIVKYDSFVCGLKNNTLYPDFRYRLRKDRQSLNDQDFLIMNLPYVINDGGYLEYLVTMHHDKQSTDEDHHYWGKRLESVRKDTECTFGSMKKRFTVLKTHMRYHDSEKIDNVFYTCCILHNMLLKFDGWDQRAAYEEFWSPANNLSENLSTSFDRDDDLVGYDARYFGYDAPIDLAVDHHPGFREKREALIRHFTIQARNKQLFWLS